MRRFHSLKVTVTLASISVAACNSGEVTGFDRAAFSLAASAFNTVPAGVGETSNSFAPGDGSMPTPWMPDRVFGGPLGMAFGGFAGGDGGVRGPGSGGLMGGGMDGAFVGGDARGRGSERGPFAGGIDDSCVFSAASGDVTCGPTVRNGLTVTRVSTFKTAAGTAQAKPDSTTDSDRTRIAVSGTVTRRDSVTATVSSSSDRTSIGLAFNSTKRTVNGKSSGTETAAGKNRDGQSFTSVRTSGDTTVNLIIPKAANSSAPSYPTAGTVTRAMRVVMTIVGSAATTSTRREVVTYDGSATAKVSVTQDGTTKACTMALPRGRLVCP